MKNHYITMLVTVILGLMTHAFAWAAPDQNNAIFSPAQETAIEAIIHDYLVEKNPEVLIEATQALQEQQQSEMLAGIQSAVVSQASILFNSDSPIAGNKSGDVSLVEFFDYQCIYCKRMTPIVNELLGDDQNVTIIFKEFPIFGEESEYAAKAALAAQNQGKYFEFHQALMQAEDRLSKDSITAIATGIGLDVQKLQEDMEEPAIQAEIDNNVMLANALGIMGTPAFIIANLPVSEDMSVRFIPGETDLSELQEAIEEVRTGD